MQGKFVGVRKFLNSSKKALLQILLVEFIMAFNRLLCLKWLSAFIVLSISADRNKSLNEFDDDLLLKRSFYYALTPKTILRPKRFWVN